MDTVPVSDDGEAGCILEVFNALGESVDVGTVVLALGLICHNRLR
jgi:hypothetical protein